jgi:hypothetical protein
VLDVGRAPSMSGPSSRPAPKRCSANGVAIAKSVTFGLLADQVSKRLVDAGRITLASVSASRQSALSSISAAATLNLSCSTLDGLSASTSACRQASSNIGACPDQT